MDDRNHRRCWSNLFTIRQFQLKQCPAPTVFIFIGMGWPRRYAALSASSSVVTIVCMNGLLNVIPAYIQIKLFVDDCVLFDYFIPSCKKLLHGVKSWERSWIQTKLFSWKLLTKEIAFLSYTIFLPAHFLKLMNTNLHLGVNLTNKISLKKKHVKIFSHPPSINCFLRQTAPCFR